MNSNPIDALFAEYVAGSLRRPEKVLVDSHIDINPVSRDWVQDLEAIGGSSLELGIEEPIKDPESMIDAIINSPEQARPSKDGLKPYRYNKNDEWMPASLRQFLGLSTKEIPWRKKIPGISVYKMDNVDGCEVNLLRIKPGSTMPSHTHEGRELTLVLKGSFDDGEGHYARGDVSIADESVGHKPIAGMSEECICLTVTDAPLRFTGPLARLVSSIMPR
ncbi:MAG: ChrR family anti-sigma-E factor [Hyphomicrobiales bacterium]